MHKLPVSILFIAACLVLAGCKTRTSYRVDGEFIYYNRTGMLIHIFLPRGAGPRNAFNMYPGDSIVVLTQGETDIKGPVDPKGYLPALSSDTTTIEFDHTQCYKEYNRQGAFIHNIDKYTYKKKDDMSYTFYFDIDSSLYLLSEPCK